VLMRILAFFPVLLMAVGCSRSSETVTPAAVAQPSSAAEQPAAVVPAQPVVQPVPATNAPKPDVVAAVPVAMPVSAPAALPAAAQPAVTLAKADAATNVAAPSVWDKLGRVVARVTNSTVNPTGATSAAPSAISLSDLSQDQVTRGLKEALAKGLDHAIGQLGKEGGFLTNVNVRIPMPENLQTVEKLLRRAGQDKLADDFVTTMNRAAEQAVPAAAGVFGESLKQMSVSDAQAILQGPKDAATEYFRRTAGPQIQEKFRPIVAQATAQAGATAAYKNLMDRASFATAFLKKDSLNLDDYVTGKATDGLFKMVADEEKKIRENPVARTTDLLKSVFGSLRK
jgi:Protein of unknown function (DUF4197)